MHEPRAVVGSVPGTGQSRMVMVGVLAVLATAAVAWVLWPPPEPDLVLYCGVDQDQSQPMVKRYEEREGVEVEYHGESEAFRSVGLPERIRREQGRADVFWSNEIMHMVALANEGLLAPLPDGLAERFPEAWRDPKGRFLQFGARARIFLVNLDKLPEGMDPPRRLEDLLDPRWRAHGLIPAMAAPLTGTTLTHAVAWLTRDEAGARDFHTRAAQAMTDGHLMVVDSNGRVLNVVKDPKQPVPFGLTDTDDAYVAVRQMQEGTGPRVAIIYPDQGADEVGTLLIPNTAAILKKAPHPEAAARFLDWLSSPEVEKELAESPTAQIPVRPDVGPLPEHVKRPPADFRAQVVDWHAVGANEGRWNEWLKRMYRPGD